MNIDKLEIYLPKFLSSESAKDLFDGLKDFPENMDIRLYSNFLRNTNLIYQGDGLRDMLMINFPDPEIRLANSIVLSNTCDIDPSNKKYFPSQIVYTPIFNLNKYRQKLLKESGNSEQKINDHIASIKKQEITQILFLPRYEGYLDESIVFLDRVLNLPRNSISNEEIETRRIFTLSDYGAYLFILKLSIHFTRIQDKVERRSIRVNNID